MGDFLRHEMLETFSIEGAADGLLREARQDGNDAPDPHDCIIGLQYTLNDEPPAEHEAMVDPDRSIIFFHPHRDPKQERWGITHELAHLAQALIGIEWRLQDERITNQIARAILMPRRPFERLMRQHGSAYSYWVTREYPCVPPLQILQRAVELGF